MQNLIGLTLSRYRIIEMIGEGGMGSVYRANDPRLMRDVAIKVMHPEYARQETFRSRFEQEARTAARLDHPGIVRIFDSGEENQILYIVMEYIHGPNLRKILHDLRLEKRPILLPEVVQVVRQVCLALEYAHRKGVLHRDIKPDNIMLKAEAVENLKYRPVLTDLGLAKLLEGIPITRQGESMGTPAYMSPEQSLGQPVDARSDVYSVGILFYELAAGQLPFPVKTISEAIRYHTKEAPPPPNKIRPDLPDSIAAMILKCLEKESGRRYRDAGELARELGAASSSLLQPGPHEPGAQVSLLNASLPQKTPDRARPGKTRGTITVMVKDREAQSFPFEAEPVTVGRGEENDIVLKDSRASRHHARIQVDQGNFCIVDLNSTNKTFLGTKALVPGVATPWPVNQLLRIGNTYLRLDKVEEGIQESALPERAHPPVSTAYGSRAYITLEPAVLQVRPGSAAALSVSVTNQSAVVDHFTVEVEGIPTDWLPVIPPGIQLMPGKRQEVSLLIQPPNSPISTAGEYPFSVVVISRAAPNETAKAKAVLTVLPFYQYGASLRPKRQRGADSGNFIIDLTNLSNSELTLHLKGTDPEEACTYVFLPAQARLQSGEESQVQLTVRPSGPPVDWKNRSFPFTVTAWLAEEPALVQTLQGEFEQTAPSLAASLYPQRQKGSRQGTYTLTLANHNPTVVHARLEGSDPENACQYLFQPAEAALQPGEEITVRLTVRLGTAVHEQGKVVPFTVTTRLRESPQITRQVYGEWEQVPYHIELNLNPTRQSSPGQAQYTVQVHNRSDDTLQIELRAFDTGNLCRYSFNQGSLVLAAGEARNVSLLVSPASSLPAGASRLIQFEAGACLTGSSIPAARVQGEWEQQSTQPLPAPAAAGYARQPAPPPLPAVQPLLPAAPKPAAAGSCLIWLIGLPLTALAGFLTGLLMSSAYASDDNSLAGAIVVWIIGLAWTGEIASRVKKRKPSLPHILIATGFILVLIAATYLTYMYS